MSYLFKRYRGDKRRAIAAYNAGEGNVKPGRRIRNIGYVNKVMRAYNKLSSGKKRRAFNPRKAHKLKKTSLKKRKRNRVNRVSKRATRKAPRRNKRTTFHVKKGHTVYEVMRQTGVPVKKIIRLNGLKAPYHLQAGEYVRIR
ncbi:MAG: hypothetical protein CR976_00705 [Thiotrichales bacterium]|nr:MAG: hypothetical protein CR976_00705 [Thiotrichales bacterium]